MNKDKDFLLDSDEDEDEDFCPEKEINSLSEEESDDDIVDKDQNDQKKKNRSGKQNRTKRKKIQQTDKDDSTVEAGVSSSRKTRKNGDVIENGMGKCSLEKEELESDEEEKNKTDALWAEFLNDVNPNVKAPKPENKKPLSESLSVSTNQQESENSPTNANKKLVTTEFFDFAGEEVKVEKTVINNGENKRSTKASGSGLGLGNTSLKRPATSSGSGAIGSVLNQLGKKKKISVLEKTKLDWNNFKVTEGIQEDLQTFNKGKDGYLERQDFLQRTDLRQFEIEKNLRQSKRNNR